MDLNPPNIPPHLQRLPAHARDRNDGPSGASRSIGETLVQLGLLDDSAVAQIQKTQVQRGLRFGEAAVMLGLVKLPDIERALARQFDYPYLPGDSDALSADVVAATQPFGAFAEQMRSLRVRILMKMLSQPMQPRSVAFVSPNRGDGRSFLAANLAVVFSQLGERTLLIDADLRRPVQHLHFNLGNRLGLSNILLGRAGLDCAHVIEPLRSLSVITAGSGAPNPQELLTRPRFSSLLSEAQAAFDVIVLDTPPMDQSADGQIVASRAGMNVLVVRPGYNETASLHRVVASMREAGSEPVGTVVNGR